MSSNDVLLGLGLVLTLAVSAQLTARWIRVPAIVVLLPAGFVAGAVTDVVHPDRLLGQLYQPFVSLAVGIVLFEAGLRLSFDEIAPRVRAVLVRLIAVGVVVTLTAVTLVTAVLFSGMDTGVAVVIGAVLVVSGPTVVLPLVAFVRPARELRTLLKWEGVLIDPVGALIGVIVFHAVLAGHAGGQRWHPGAFVASVGIGAAVGVAGAAVLLVVLRQVQRNAPSMAVGTTLAVVIGTIVAADLLRDDAGFVAATLMGAALGNQRFLASHRRVDVSVTLGFHEALVQLLIGVLFVLIAASVSPDDVRAVLARALLLVLVMLLIVRPLVVAVALARSRFTIRERAFVAWMAPRGIVAGATASAFGLQLQQEGLAGAGRVLPIVFVVIFATVVVYGLTAPVVASLLHVAGTERGLVLVVGGDPWSRDLASALQRAGAAVRMWVGPAADRDAARAAGIDADRGSMLLDAVSREAELDEVTDVLLLTRSDDFNAIAATELRKTLGHDHVLRVAPDPEGADLLPPPVDARFVGSEDLTFAELRRRVAAGARIVAQRNDEPAAAEDLPLLVLSPSGRIAAPGPPAPGGIVLVLRAQPGSHEDARTTTVG